MFNIIHRSWTRIIAAVLCVSLVSLATTGCEQSTIAALTTTLGNAASAIAALEGNTGLATQLTTDTTAAANAIANWKSGTPAQNVVQALTIVENDLNLIPGTSQYAPLIDIAIATVQSILALLPVTTTPTVAHGRTVHLGYAAPKSSHDFKKKWNAAVVANKLPVTAEIK